MFHISGVGVLFLTFAFSPTDQNCRLFWCDPLAARVCVCVYVRACVCDGYMPVTTRIGFKADWLIPDVFCALAFLIPQSVFKGNVNVNKSCSSMQTASCVTPELPLDHEQSSRDAWIVVFDHWPPQGHPLRVQTVTQSLVWPSSWTLTL